METIGYESDNIDAVCVSRTRYEELLRAEAERDTLLRFYRTAEGYRAESAMRVVFGPKEGGIDAE